MCDDSFVLCIQLYIHDDYYILSDIINKDGSFREDLDILVFNDIDDIDSMSVMVDDATCGACECIDVDFIDGTIDEYDDDQNDIVKKPFTNEIFDKLMSELSYYEKRK